VRQAAAACKVLQLKIPEAPTTRGYGREPKNTIASANTIDSAAIFVSLKSVILQPSVFSDQLCTFELVNFEFR